MGVISLPRLLTGCVWCGLSRGVYLYLSTEYFFLGSDFWGGVLEGRASTEMSIRNMVREAAGSALTGTASLPAAAAAAAASAWGEMDGREEEEGEEKPTNLSKAQVQYWK